MDCMESNNNNNNKQIKIMHFETLYHSGVEISFSRKD